MKWFDKWFAKKCRQAWNEDQPCPSPISINEINNGPSCDGMNIRVWGATGGHIVEFRKYDIQKDRNDNRMYIISTDKDFSESLTKIISMEMLR
jgi:hypothetical protein